MTNKTIVIIIHILFLVLLWSSSANAYDDEITHPELTKKAIASSTTETYLQNNLGHTFANGVEKALLNGKSVRDWLAQGSTDEDHPNCQAANHFHNPLLPWNASQMSDDSTPLAYLIREYCNAAGWPYVYRKSNVTWSTGYLSLSPDGSKYMFLSSESPKPTNWDSARASYYSALIGQSAADRDADFAATFSALGHVLHLIQDMAVPGHVRNDFQSHLFSHGWGINNNYYNRYEYYVMNHNNKINAVQAMVPPDSNRRLTDFWDTNTYDGTNPSYSTAQGLAEFTNANFFSEFTIPLSQDFPVSQEHTFPKPGLDYYGNRYYLCNDTNESGQLVKYLSRLTCSMFRPIDHFLTVSLLNRYDGPATIFWTDDKVHDTYAKELLPRAVGYSAALLNYFFRGTIEIGLPDDGVYAITSPDGIFKKIKLNARNTTASGEEMTNGMVQLVVKYKISPTDPFSPDFVCRETTPQEFTYIVASGASGVTSIPTTTTTLTFNLPENTGIPLNASDVYLQVVYKGQLGNEAGAVAVGFKDISEPTPLDIVNNMDCGYQQRTITADYLSFNLKYYADPNLYSAYFPSIPPGYYGRVFFLADSDYYYSYTNLQDGDMKVAYRYGFINQANPSTGVPYCETISVFRGLIAWQWYNYYNLWCSSSAPLIGPVPVVISPELR